MTKCELDLVISNDLILYGLAYVRQDHNGIKYRIPPHLMTRVYYKGQVTYIGRLGDTEVQFPPDQIRVIRPKVVNNSPCPEGPPEID